MDDLVSQEPTEPPTDDVDTEEAEGSKDPAPRVKGNVYTWKNRPPFDLVLCELPEEIHILATGQVVCHYGIESSGPEVIDEDGDIRQARKLKAELPPLPYEDLDDMLEEHCQGSLTPNDLRRALHDEPARECSYARWELQSIKRYAIEFWGSAYVQFEPRLA